MHSESGFTLIELLVAMAIIGILYATSVTSYGVYTQKAAYHVLLKTMHDAQVAYETGVSDIDNPPTSVSFTQTNQGGITNATGQDLFVGMMLPKNVRFSALYDQGCAAAGCTEGTIILSHCNASESLIWTRFGDGTSLLLENVPGGGC